MKSQLLAPSKPSSTHLLARLLETPGLAAGVQALPAEVLARVIDRVGLEDAGEIVAFATTEQLARVFDEDLWKSEKPGQDERFDAERFVVWLSVLLEAGDAFVAEKLSELPPDLVTLALHGQVLVLDMEAMIDELRAADEREATRVEKALSNCLSEEIETYQLVSRRQEGWDDVLTAILALDRDHHDFLMGVLERCCAMSAEVIEENGGLYDVLTSEEMLESDVAAEREDRRGEAGHVSPSAAAAFLKIARKESASTERDPMTRAYFRGLSRDEVRGVTTESPAPPPPDLLHALREAGLTETPGRLLAAAREEELLLPRAMRALAGEPSFAARSEELAYVANVLAAGCSFQGRRFRQVEAVRAALATCNLGLELASGPRLEVAVKTLQTRGADALFRLAWRRLDVEVIQGAAARAERALRTAGEPRAAARVSAAAGSGRPWEARAELEALADDWLYGLLDECPTVNGAFISRASELAQIRTELAR